MGKSGIQPANARVYANHTSNQKRSVYMTELNDINERYRHKVKKIQNETQKKIEKFETEYNFDDDFMTEERFDTWMAKYEEEPDKRKREIKQQRLMKQYTCVSTVDLYHTIILDLYC